MAKAKINETELDTLNEHLVKAIGHLDEAQIVWGNNFENLYNNFITNGFLEDLYKDAESQYYNLANAGYLLSYVVQDAGLGMTIGGLIGAIIPIPVVDDVIGAVAGALIGAIVGLIRGITHCVKNPTSVKWRYDAKNVFEELLTRCVNGNDDNYIALINSHVKQEHMELALLQIRQKVNAFQQMYANLTEAAQGAGVDINLASDGTTVLGIKSEVTIDGKTIEMDASEAMAAVYTYINTAMNGLVSAELISQEYGIDVSYMDVLKDTNSFMANTIESDLYTHEFIEGVLPEYSYSENEVVSKVADILGLDASEVGSLLGNVSGVTNLSIYPAALGASLLGNVGAAIADKNKQDDDDDDGDDGGDDTTVTPPGGITIYPGGTTITPEDTTGTEPETEPEITNDIELEEVVENELPEKVETEIKKDYDQMARDEYEFGQDVEEIAEFRADLSLEVQEQYFSGDLSVLKERLEGYGYSGPEADAILNDPTMTINAVIEGETRAILSEKAAELAKADGVEDFESKYSEADYSSLEEQPVELLVLSSYDENVCELKDNLDVALEEYEAAVEDTNAALEAVTESKTNMEAIQEKYEAEFGEDTSKWSEEAATEYNESIKAYNESVEAATTKVEELNGFKDKYNEANEAFVEAKDNYYKDIASSLNAEIGDSVGVTDPIVNPTPDVGGNTNDVDLSQSMLDQFMGNGN